MSGDRPPLLGEPNEHGLGKSRGVRVPGLGRGAASGAGLDHGLVATGVALEFGDHDLVAEA